MRTQDDLGGVMFDQRWNDAHLVCVVDQLFDVDGGHILVLVHSHVGAWWWSTGVVSVV